MPVPAGNNFNPEGRPEKNINWSQFEKLCSLQCTQDEMASILEVSGYTLSKKVQEKYGEDYLTIYKRFSASGKCSLRRYQFVMSEKHPAMAIWLGKQWLGQKDTVIETQVSEEIDKRFSAIMSQIGGLQTIRNMSDIKASEAAKSELVTGSS